MYHHGVLFGKSLTQHVTEMGVSLSYKSTRPLVVGMNNNGMDPRMDLNTLVAEVSFFSNCEVLFVS